MKFLGEALAGALAGLLVFGAVALLSNCAANVEPEDTSGTWCFRTAANGNTACYSNGYDSCEADRLRHSGEQPDEACWRNGQ
jgi:hypothetical protein